MSKVQAFDPVEVTKQNPAEFYEILFDTGKEVLLWTEKGFVEIAGKVHVQMLFTKSEVEAAYNLALKRAQRLLKPGILHIVPVHV